MKKESRSKEIMDWKKENTFRMMVQLNNEKDKFIIDALKATKNKNDLIRKALSKYGNITLGELEKLLNEDYAITIEDLTKSDDETNNDDYSFFKDIEDSKLCKQVCSIDFWENAKGDKSYYIVIK